MADTIGSLSAGPTKVLAEWTADRIAPAYWIPNFQITVSSLVLSSHLLKCSWSHEHNRHAQSYIQSGVISGVPVPKENC